MYWIDKEHNHIATCDFYGNNYIITTQSVFDEPFSLTNFDKNLYYLYDNKIKTVSADRKINIQDQNINRLSQTDNSNIIHYQNQWTQPETVVNTCKCMLCLCIPSGNTLELDSKCYCESFQNQNTSIDFVKNKTATTTYALYTTTTTNRNSIIDILTSVTTAAFSTISNTNSLVETTTIESHKSYILADLTLKVGSLIIFVLVFLSVVIGLKLKPPKWLLNSVVNTTNKYIFKFRRKNDNPILDQQSGPSITTVDSNIDLDNDVVLSEFNGANQSVRSYHMNQI